MTRPISAKTLSFVRAAVVATGLGLAATQAHAAVVTDVTWAPAGNVTFNSFQVSDFSQVAFTGPAAGGAVNFTDTGFLPISQFNFNGTSTNPSGYTLYFAFNGTGTVNQPQINAGTLGNFNSLTFGFYQVAGSPTFTPSFASQTQATPPTIDGITSTSGALPGTLLATGSLTNGTVFGSTNGGGLFSPGSNVLTTFTPVPSAAASAFFVDPSISGYPLNLSAIFTNTPQGFSFFNVGGQLAGFNIFQGGGQADFVGTPTPVPEPVSLTLLGAGLAFAGFARSRRQAF